MVEVCYKMLPYKWAPFQVPSPVWPNPSWDIQQKIGEALRAWEGTPYMSGQQTIGVGADCIRYLAAFVDQMYGYKRCPTSRLPQDYSMHTREGAFSVMRQILRIYPEMQKVEGNTLEPGDVIVVGPKDGGPGHCLIVGDNRNTLWHAVQPRVCRTGWALMKDHQKIFRVYRFKDRMKWT